MASSLLLAAASAGQEKPPKKGWVMISMKNKRAAGPFRIIQPVEASLEPCTAYGRTLSGEPSSELARETKRAASWKRLLPIAAFLLAATALTVGGCNAAAEAGEPARAEMKEACRDVTVERFGSGKTATALKKRIIGYEIAQSEPSRQDLENLWINLEHANADSVYEISYSEPLDSALGFGALKSSVLAKTNAGGGIVWSASFDNLFVDRHVERGGYVAVCGYEPICSSEMPLAARLALVSAEDGAVLWDNKLSTGYERENIKSLVFDGDKISVFAEGDFKTLVIMNYDLGGNGFILAENELGGQKFVEQAVKLGDGYLARLRTADGGESLVKIGANGKFDSSFAYSSEDTEYFIADMQDWGGRVYLSAYAVPKLKKGEGDGGGRSEIAAILSEAFEKEGWEISDEELTGRMREHFSAVLLVCDAESGVPQGFYSVRGSIGDALEVSGNGYLKWNVGSISGSFFSPMTSSFSIAATCRVYSYEYSASGNLASQAETNETISFRR
jgi:hypothetical protein